MEATRRINTRSPIVTRVLMQTFVHINGTILSGEAPTLADGPRHPLLAHPAVLARVRVAVLAVVAALPAQLGRTLAMEVVLQVDALGPVQAGVGRTGVEIKFTGGSRKSCRAGAGKA